jgi:predicted amidohydrolase
MRTYSFISLLGEASSVEDLARRLGAVCLDQEAELQKDLDVSLLREMVDGLRDHVIASEPTAWQSVVEDPESLPTHLGSDFTAVLEQAEGHYPLDCLGVLRGLCRRVLPHLYLRQEGLVPLDRGVPVPFAPRPLLPAVEKTPHPETGSSGSLLGRCNHRLFEFWRDRETVRVTLDFQVRRGIDELTWTAEERLPRIATVHPRDCGSLRIDSITDEGFFDARPEHWRPDEVAELLSRVSDVEIAVLPELSLPDSEALADLLARDSESFPRLVVAGSAHLREGERPHEVRANEAAVYLDGESVASHRKCNAYEATKLGGKSWSPPLREALTREPKEIVVLSGEYSRLAIVICNDLNDTGSIPQKLLAGAVNTLVVPSFTSKKGAFRGPMGDLAARCQAVAVVANAPPADAASPFHGMVAVPLPDPKEGIEVYPAPGEEAGGQIAVIDPNKPLQEAIDWR